jgi:hypothetical protein
VTRRPVRLQPAHRWHAPDGPEERVGARPIAECSDPTSKPRRSRTASGPTTGLHTSRGPEDLQPRRVGATDSRLSPRLRARTEFLYPTGFSSAACTWQWCATRVRLAARAGGRGRRGSDPTSSTSRAEEGVTVRTRVTVPAGRFEVKQRRCPSSAFRPVGVENPAPLQCRTDGSHRTHRR